MDKKQDKPVFYCYSKRLHKYLTKRNVDYIGDGYGTKKNDPYWIYSQNDELHQALMNYGKNFRTNNGLIVHNKFYFYETPLPPEQEKYKCEMICLYDIAFIKKKTILSLEDVEEWARVVGIKSKKTIDNRIKLFIEYGWLEPIEGKEVLYKLVYLS